MILRMMCCAWIIAHMYSYANASNHIAHSYIIGNSHQILVPKTTALVQMLSTEIAAKTGIHVYVGMVDDITVPSLYPSQEARKRYQISLYKHLQHPYVLLLLFVQERKFALASSEGLHDFLDDKALDAVYENYMVPLLPTQEKDITPQRLSAIVLNGYAEIADIIAQHYHIQLEHAISKELQGVRSFTRILLYAMAAVLLGLFVWARFAKKAS